MDNNKRDYEIKHQNCAYIGNLLYSNCAYMLPATLRHSTLIGFPSLAGKGSARFIGEFESSTKSAGNCGSTKWSSIFSNLNVTINKQ